MCEIERVGKRWYATAAHPSLTHVKSEALRAVTPAQGAHTGVASTLQVGERVHGAVQVVAEGCADGEVQLSRRLLAVQHGHVPRLGKGWVVGEARGEWVGGGGGGRVRGRRC